MKSLLAFALLFALSSPASAQNDGAPIDCNNAMNQAEMNTCAYDGWKAADRELNDAYGNAMKAMKEIDNDLPAKEKGAAKALREAQRAWISFRDHNCAAEGFKMHGGSAEPLLIYGCKEVLTQQRIKDLRDMAEEN